MPEPTAEERERNARLRARMASIREANRRENERRTSVGHVANQALSRYGEMRRREHTAERYTLKQILQQAVEHAVEHVFGQQPPEGMRMRVYAESVRLLGIGGVRINPRRGP